MPLSTSVVDTDEVRCDEGTNTLQEQQPLSLPSTEDGDSRNTLASLQGKPATTDEDSLPPSSSDPSTPPTQSYRDGKDTDESTASQDRPSIASPSANETSQRQKLERINARRLRWASLLMNPMRFQIGNPPETTADPCERTALTGASGRRRYFRRQRVYVYKTPSAPVRHGQYLTVEKRHSDGRKHKLSKCKWTLLSKPSSLPNVPVIAVTDPKGVVMYPHDHTYYLDECVELEFAEDSDEI
ncbi:hypothetical protein F5Y05DRAFT_95384 [Hypoxylon sp. FL0543]|nr:hypothetical protein F5Y05DRAFT_95384 [Hypoxylon sp. FL0543]